MGYDELHQIKEIFRGVKSKHPWSLLSMMVKELVMYCVSCINIWHMMAIKQTVVPKVLFTGIKVDYREYYA